LEPWIWGVLRGKEALLWGDRGVIGRKRVVGVLGRLNGVLGKGGFMELCSSGHDEVCYEGGRCPVCDVLSDKKAVEEDLKRSEKEVASLQDEVDGLKEKVSELENKL